MRYLPVFAVGRSWRKKITAEIFFGSLCVLLIWGEDNASAEELIRVLDQSKVADQQPQRQRLQRLEPLPPGARLVRGAGRQPLFPPPRLARSV